MHNRYKRALAGAVLLGLTAAPTRADRIPYLDPVPIPEAGLHPYSIQRLHIQRLHAGIAWLKAHAAHALHARPEARPVKEVLVARGGPRMEIFDALERVHHQLGSLGGAGTDLYPEGEDRYSRTSIREALYSLDGAPELAGLSLKVEFVPARDPEWSTAPESAVPETPAVPEPAGAGLMALGMLGMAALRGRSRHKRASSGRA